MAILNDNDFEGLRLYPENGKLHKIIGNQIKNVFEKMFQNTDVNFDDFYFTGFDSDNPNAFFIEKSKTNTDKNIIAVSRGLIKSLDSVEELAAIIGHESGHYLWSELLGGKNTIFQERGSDLYSVDLMMNAGYNPRYIISAQKKIFGDLNYESSTLDVHGNSFSRVSDVEAYITKIATERGDFPPVDKDVNPDWKKFQSDVHRQYEIEGYDTYLDKKLKEKFKTKDITKLNRIDVLRLFYDEIKSDNITNYTIRLDDFYSKFKNLNIPENKSSQEIYVLQNIFLLLNSKLNKITKTDNIIRFLRNILYESKLEKFGPFMEQYQNIASFIKYYDDEFMAEFFAKRILNLSWTVDFIKSFKDSSYPRFYPFGQNNVGKMLPWDKLYSYNNKYITDALGYFGLSDDNFYNNRIYSKKEAYDKEDYYFGKNKIVIAFGDKAHELYERDRKNQFMTWFNSYIEESNKNIDDFLSLMNDFMLYESGKLSFEQFVEKMNHVGPKKYLLGLTGDYKIGVFDDEKIKLMQKYKIDLTPVYQFYQKLQNSKFYKDYVKTSPEFSLYPVLDKNVDINVLIGRINFLLNVSNLYNPYQMYMHVLCDFADKLSLTQNKDNHNIASEIYLSLLHNRPVFNQISHDKNLYQDNWQDIEEKRKNIDIYDLIYKKYFDEKIPHGSARNPVIAVTLPVYLVNALERDMKLFGKSPDLLPGILSSFGITKMPENNQELIVVLAALQNKDKNAWGLRRNVLQIMCYVLADYMTRGYQLDIISVLDTFLDFDLEQNSSAIVREIFAKHIKLDYFNKLSLDNKIRLYEFMDEKNLFSQTTANKNLFIKIIVDEIVQNKHPKSVQFAQNFLTRQPNSDMGLVASGDFQFAAERTKLIDFYADYWANKFGVDDASDKYLNKVQTEFVDFVNSSKDGNNNKLFSSMIAKSLGNAVSEKIVAQEHVAKILGDLGREPVRGSTAEKYDSYGRFAEYAFSELAHNKNTAKASIEFLNEKLSNESIDKLLRVIVNELNKEKAELWCSAETLTLIHENFWDADLPVRAYLMNRLLNAYSTNDKDKLKFVVDMYFDSKSKYYNDAVLVLNSVYNNLQDYEKSLILSALCASGQNDGATQGLSSGTQVGRGLKMFLQTKGAAFVKFGQLLSYLPTLDSDIRKELSTLREKANIPTRADLFEMMKNSLPESEMKKISRVGKILGGGSFYVTVQVKYDGQDCVVALMRPHTRDLTISGINMISRSIDDMAKQDKSYAALKNIVEQARDSSFSEIDIQQDYKKYEHAVDVYQNLTVKTPYGRYSPDVAKWLAWGADSNKENAYKIMEMAPGMSLTSAKISEAEKHDFAIAYTALELMILLSGERWDTDRHAGQQNFYNKDFRDFCIGIFDTGAQMKDAPKKSDKIMLGHLLYELVRGARAGHSIGDVLTNKIKKIDDIGKQFKIDTMYIDGVQRGLTALSDIIEYQKEIKDENGNVVQESKSLSEDDLQNIITAVLDSGMVDKTVMKSIVGKAIINKLYVLRPGWFKSLPEGIKQTTSNISIFYNGYKNNRKTINELNKSAEEIKRRLQENMSKKHLGVEIGLTEKDDKNTFINSVTTVSRA